VGQQNPVNASALHPGFDEQYRLVDDGDGTVGVGIGATETDGSWLSFVLQQSNTTPSGVGQQSPANPSAAHRLLLLQVRCTGDWEGLDVGLITFESQQSSVTPVAVGQQ
jgi:hypothetical protein